MKHRIFISTEVEKVTAQQEEMLLRCIDTALAEEGMEFPCEVNVLLTDDEGIRTLNREQRNIDAPTDVLSFPQFELLPGVPVADEENDNFDRFELEADEKGEDYLPLGDMAISLERAAAQAQEYGHSVERELGYLCVHSVLHLLGYDHMDGDEGPMKRQMRSREEVILTGLGLKR
jgi:probable rRNA maturation factor